MGIPGNLVEGQKLLGEKEFSRAEWENYLVYTRILSHWLKFLKKYLRNQEVNYFYGLIIRLIMEKSITDSNKALTIARNPLLTPVLKCLDWHFSYNKTMWDHLNTTDRIFARFSMEEKNLQKWRTYEINEEGMRFMFSPQERVMVCFSLLQKMVDLDKLKELGHLDRYSAIHNRYLLFGQLLRPMFQPVIKPVDAEEMNLFPAEQQGPKNDDLEFLFNQIMPASSSTDFIKRPLSDENAFYKISNALGISVPTMYNYYGSKIAIFFVFLSYFIKMTLGIGLLIWILDFVRAYYSQFRKFINSKLNLSIGEIQVKPTFEGLDSESNLLLANTFLICIWSCVFLEFWKKRESFYSIEFGQFRYLKEEKERSSFKSTYERNVGNGNYNDLKDFPTARLTKMVVSFLISAVIIALSVLSVFLMLYFRYWIDQQNTYQWVKEYIPIVFDSIRIAVFDGVYGAFARRSNVGENHKTRSTFEISLIFKLFSFKLINNFISYFIIIYLKGNVSWVFLKNCLNSSTDSRACFTELGTQVKGVFAITQVIGSITGLLIPWLIIKIRLRKPFLSRDYVWGAIDVQIMTEDKANSFDESEEVEGTISKFTDVIIRFAYMSFFGISYPFCFLFGTLFNIIDLHSIKIHLMYLTKRPIPKLGAGINSWYYIINVVIFMSFFVSSSILCFNANIFESTDPGNLSPAQNAFARFSMLVILQLLIKKVISVMFKAGTGEKMAEGIKRSDFNIEKAFTVEKGKGGASTSLLKAGFPMSLNPKQSHLVHSQELRLNEAGEEEIAVQTLHSRSGHRSFGSRSKSKNNSRGDRSRNLSQRSGHQQVVQEPLRVVSAVLDQQHLDANDINLKIPQLPDERGTLKSLEEASTNPFKNNS